MVRAGLCGPEQRAEESKTATCESRGRIYAVEEERWLRGLSWNAAGGCPETQEARGAAGMEGREEARARFR